MFLTDRYTVQLTGSVPGATFSFSDLTKDGLVITSSHFAGDATVSWMALQNTF